MDVTLRLYAGLRERTGSDALTLELPDDARVADALARVAELTAGVPVVMAVNREYADEATALAPGDELALIPPVSGGERDRVHARITDEPLAVDPLLAWVSDPRAGALLSFTGVTREVGELEYEAYVEMASIEIERIAREALVRHGLCAAAVEHRTGTVALSQASIVIAVSAPHRAEAFAGGREIIDRVKALAPIWKKEAGAWVSGATPRPDRPSS